VNRTRDIHGKQTNLVSKQTATVVGSVAALRASVNSGVGRVEQDNDRIEFVLLTVEQANCQRVRLSEERQTPHARTGALLVATD
jgi:hypothetical protein